MNQTTTVCPELDTPASKSQKRSYKYKIPEQFQHPERFVFENPMTFPAAKWDIQTDLFVKHERFTFTPVNRMNVMEFEMNVPKKAVRASFGAGGLQFEMENIPAYEEEEYAPPEDATKSWIALYYAQNYDGGDGYWLGIAKYWSREYDKYIGKSKVVEREAACDECGRVVLTRSLTPSLVGQS
jgi:hypothetical protein